MQKLSVLIIIMLVASACGLSSNKITFNISTPQGWDRKDSIEEENDTIVKLKSPLDGPDDAFRENIMLIANKPIRLSSFMSNTRDYIKGDAAIYEETGEGHRMIDGIRSPWFEVKVKYKTSMLTCTQRYYFLLVNGHIYTFICTCLNGEYEKFRPSVDGVLDSFKVL